MADGAGQPFLDVFSASTFEALYDVIKLGTPNTAPLERCTDVVVRSRETTLLSHHEQ